MGILFSKFRKCKRSFPSDPSDRLSVVTTPTAASPGCERSRVPVRGSRFHLHSERARQFIDGNPQWKQARLETNLIAARHTGRCGALRQRDLQAASCQRPIDALHECGFARGLVTVARSRRGNVPPVLGASEFSALLSRCSALRRLHWSPLAASFATIRWGVRRST